MSHPPAHTKSVEIRWRDLDGFNHVNNSTYLTYLEEGRDELFTTLLGHATTERIVLRRVEIDFLSGLTQSDVQAVVELWVVGLGESSVVTQELIRSGADGRLTARARAVTVHTNAARDAAEPLPADARDLLEPLLGEPGAVS